MRKLLIKKSCCCSAFASGRLCLRPLFPLEITSLFILNIFMLGRRAEDFRAWIAPKEVNLHTLPWLSRSGVVTVQTAEDLGAQKTLSSGNKRSRKVQ